MKRYFYIIYTIIFLFACACAYSDSTARILLGSREIRGIFDGRQAYVSADILSQLNAKEISRHPKLVFTTAEGKRAEISVLNYNFHTMVSAHDLFSAIGAKTSWNPQTNTFTAYALLNSVGFEDGRLKMNLSFPVQSSVSYTRNKIIVSLVGAKNNCPAETVHINSGSIIRARIGQYKENEVRVVLDVRKKVPYAIEGKDRDSEIVLDVDKTPSQNVATVKTPALSRAVKNLSKEQPAAEQKNTAFKVYKVLIDPINSSTFNIILATTCAGSVDVERDSSGKAITITIPKSAMPDDLKSVQTNLDIVDKINIDNNIVKITTTKPIMVSQPMITSPATIIRVTTADLSGKLVVVDPGHGGSQTGAISNDVQEKMINFQIAKVLADELRSEGMRVILTRERDVDMGLYARPQVAIEQKADFFISLHCNSNSSGGSASGIETYYHMNKNDSKLLAKYIQADVCTYANMPNRNARSDGSLYSSGLAVLRKLAESSIPGVLVECGYINNASDRQKLCDPDSQRNIAKGITAGIKDYMRNSTD